MNNPTTLTYNSLNSAYEFFNQELFGSSLPPCLITMQRHKGAYGYFCGERFAKTNNPQEVTDEIALNPLRFADRQPREIISTLVHEMVHLWQHHFGTPPRKGYHDKQWAFKMLEIGLTPTSTGEEGGKTTGQFMTHLITENGRFARAATQFLTEHPTIFYQDRAAENDPVRKKKAASKTKYTCERCGLNVWAKPEVSLICGDCLAPMPAAVKNELRG